MQLPNPVRNEQKQNHGTEPVPLAYARCKGKYPTPRRIAPPMTAGRGPRFWWSMNMPTGGPVEYIPKLPKRPIKLL